MDISQRTKHIFFITDNKYFAPKENESITIHKYFDVSKKRLFSFIFQKDELFVILNQGTFGSAFFGNTVINEPKYFIIKKFNPIFILIQIIYNTGEEADKKNKISDLKKDEFIDINAIIQTYSDNLKKLEDKTDNFNNNFDSIFKSSVNFVKNIFNKYSSDIGLITETQEIKYDSGEEKNICVKKLESKVFNYLNSKINLNEEEIKEIRESCALVPSDEEVLTQRKIYEKITILEPFLPVNLYKNYLNYKHLDFLNEDEVSKISAESANKANKRKNKEEKSNKREKKKKGEKNVEVPKNQASILDMFNKKK